MVAEKKRQKKSKDENVSESAADMIGIEEFQVRRQLLGTHPASVKLAPSLELCVGSRVMLTMNVGTIAGLVNGVVGTVVGFLYNSADVKPIMTSCSDQSDAAYNEPALPIVLVKLDTKNDNTYSFESYLLMCPALSLYPPPLCRSNRLLPIIVPYIARCCHWNLHGASRFTRVKGCQSIRLSSFFSLVV